MTCNSYFIIGDIVSTFDDLSRSVIDVLNFQLYGVPLVGADICGFGGIIRIHMYIHVHTCT